MADNPRIEELRRRVQADPASIAFAALAEEFRRAGRYQDAIETCRTGLQRHPSYLSARSHSAVRSCRSRSSTRRARCSSTCFARRRKTLRRSAPWPRSTSVKAKLLRRSNNTESRLQVATQEAEAAAAAQSAPTPPTPPSVTASNPKPFLCRRRRWSSASPRRGFRGGRHQDTTVAAPAKIAVKPSPADGGAGQPPAGRMPPLEAIPALVPHDRTNRRVLENLQRRSRSGAPIGFGRQ